MPTADTQRLYDAERLRLVTQERDALRAACQLALDSLESAVARLQKMGLAPTPPKADPLTETLRAALATGGAQ